MDDNKQNRPYSKPRAATHATAVKLLSILFMKYPSPHSHLASIACVVAIFANIAAAKELPITPDTDVEELAKQVTAGDSIVLQDGTWIDAELKFERLPGTAADPIQIRPQTPGKVVFSGSTEFRVSGTHIIVSGFVFRDTNDVSDVVQLRTHSKRHAHHCRFTDCVFEQTPEAPTGIESRWLSVFGTHNRIDHCYFGGKRSRGPTLVVWVSEDVDEEHRIDHNHFGFRPELGKNGGETIRIGTSEVSEANCKTVVEENYFHKCNGEAEIISNKACENIYRQNVFDECEGALTLRHGHRCLVDSNLFLGRKATGTGGVRVIGAGHTVTNNYFEGLRGNEERAAICVMNGIPKYALNSYAPVRDATIAHNTVIDCKMAMEIGYRAGKKQSAAPTNCQITHNLFLPSKWWLFRFHAQPVDCNWDGNRLQIGDLREELKIEIKRIDSRLDRADDGLLRPTTPEALSTDEKSLIKNDIDGQPRGDTAIAGCDEPNTQRRTWVTEATTGPTWK